MDIHHVLNRKKSSEFLIGYDVNDALAVALPTNEHFALTKNNKKHSVDFMELFNQEIECLKNFTNLPDDIIDVIKQEIKKKYRI